MDEYTKDLYTMIFLCRLCKIRELQSEKLYAKEFQYEGLLKEKLRRQTEINSQLEIKEEEEVVMAEEMEETIAPPQAATIARQGYTTEVYFSERSYIYGL